MRALLLTLAAVSIASEAIAATSCSPKDNTARVLNSPSPNAVHPNWRGENYVGLSWSLKTDGRVIRNETGSYLRGNLISPRGGVADRGVYVITGEWSCSRS